MERESKRPTTRVILDVLEPIRIIKSDGNELNSVQILISRKIKSIRFDRDIYTNVG